MSIFTSAELICAVSNAGGLGSLGRDRRDEAKRQAERLLGELVKLTKQGKIGEALPAAGQSAGLIGEIRPCAEILRRIVDEAESLLRN